MSKIIWVQTGQKRGISYIRENPLYFKPETARPNVIVMLRILVHLKQPQAKQLCAKAWKALPEKGLLISEMWVSFNRLKD